MVGLRVMADRVQALHLLLDVGALQQSGEVLLRGHLLVLGRSLFAEDRPLHANLESPLGSSGAGPLLEYLEVVDLFLSAPAGPKLVALNRQAVRQRYFDIPNNVILVPATLILVHHCHDDVRLVRLAAVVVHEPFLPHRILARLGLLPLSLSITVMTMS